MATITRGYTFGTTETVTAAKLHSLVDSATISNIVAADLAAGAVSGSKILMGGDTRGDILYFNGTSYARLAAGTSGQFLKATGAGSDPTWDTPSGVATFATPTVTLSDTASAGALTTTLKSDCVIAAFDATLPTSLAIGDSAAVGDAAFAARRNHKHGMPAFAAPSVTFGTSAAAGSAVTLLRSDCTLPIFDGTLPAEIEFGGAGSTGSATVAARRDHVHPIDSAGLTITTDGKTSNTADPTNSTFVDICGTVTVTATGNPIILIAALRVQGNVDTVDGNIKILRSDDSASFTWPLIDVPNAGRGESFVWADVPSAGSVTYKLQANVTSGQLDITSVNFRAIAF